MNPRFRRILTGILLVVILSSMLGVIYVAVNPPNATEPYTEFYVLGSDGNASNYPTNLSVGETGTVVVGISNHEHRPMDYTVVMQLDNETVSKRTVHVDNEETWQDSMSFTPQETGRQKLRLMLYRGTDADLSQEPYRHLRLWINVSQ